MQLIAGTRDFFIPGGTVSSIGKFDGRHKGHQKLLRTMCALGESRGLKTAILTFDMAPLAVVEHTPKTQITTNGERRANMEQMGIDYLIEYPFDEQTARMSPEDFVADILVGRMSARAVVVGTDCSFGYKGAGDAALLCELAKRHGFEAVVLEKERDESRDISSTYIREMLDRGDMEKANRLLGEPYSIHGMVVHGNHLGGPGFGFPTANILPPPVKHLPPFGVYVSLVTVDGRTYGGVTNIGRKPTLRQNSPVGVETYVLGLDENLYGREITVRLLNYERPERTFSSLDELKNQIKNDREYARTYLASHPETAAFVPGSGEKSIKNS